MGSGNKSSHIDWVDGGLKWQGGRIPRDGSTVLVRVRFVGRDLYGIMCTLACTGIMLALGLLAFSHMYRGRRLIKMSSPNINNLILVGCMLTYVSVLFQDQSTETIQVYCTIRILSFIIGFSLAFGALFAKTWRVHRIMTSSIKTAKSVMIRDSQLYIIVGSLVMTNTNVFILWQALHPFSINVINTTTQVSPDDPDIIHQTQVYVCRSDYQLYYTVTLYTIQGLLLIFGTFLAWETRKIHVEVLNDSRQIGLCIYNVLILSILGAAINFVLGHNVHAKYGFISGFIIAGTTLTQGILFIPKVRLVLLNQDTVEPTMTRMTTTSSHQPSAS